MKFQQLTDDEWKFIEPMLPPPAHTGRPRADDRTTINGILYVLTTCCKWEDMPEEYGAYVTAWRRHRDWQEKGIWGRILEALKNKAYVEGKLSIESVSIDSKTISAKKGANV